MEDKFVLIHFNDGKIGLARQFGEKFYIGDLSSIEFIDIPSGFNSEIERRSLVKQTLVIGTFDDIAGLKPFSFVCVEFKNGKATLFQEIGDTYFYLDISTINFPGDIIEFVESDVREIIVISELRNGSFYFDNDEKNIKVRT